MVIGWLAGQHSLTGVDATHNMSFSSSSSNEIANTQTLVPFTEGTTRGIPSTFSEGPHHRTYLLPRGAGEFLSYVLLLLLALIRYCVCGVLSTLCCSSYCVFFLLSFRCRERRSCCQAAPTNPARTFVMLPPPVIVDLLF